MLLPFDRTALVCVIGDLLGSCKRWDAWPEDHTVSIDGSVGDQTMLHFMRVFIALIRNVFDGELGALCKSACEI